jgi:hypothetical protein
MLHYRLIPSNTATAAERRIPFVLRDATDLITPEDISVTGVKVSLSLNNGTFANSTNDIVKDSGTLGIYHLELTTAEANQTRGSRYVGHLQPSGCARAYIVADIGPAGLYDVPSTTTQIRDAILSWEPYTGYSLARLLRAMGIVLRGTASGLATSSATYTAPAGGATVTATVDADGNRSVVSDTASGTP